MKKSIFLFVTLVFIFSPLKTWARHTMALGAFGGGDFQIIKTFPDLDIGAGGGISFEYRFNQRWGLQTSLSVFTHDGVGTERGDKDMFLLNLPAVDLKFYFLTEEHSFDPYLSAGLGLNVLTSGSVSNNSGGAGMGAQVGIGADFYVSDVFSLGIGSQFRTLGIIRDNSQSSALIFITALGNFTYHFK